MKKSCKVGLLLLLLVGMLLLCAAPVLAEGDPGTTTTAVSQEAGEGSKLSVPVVAAVIAGGAVLIALAVLLPNAIKVKKNR